MRKVEFDAALFRELFHRENAVLERLAKDGDDARLKSSRHMHLS